MIILPGAPKRQVFGSFRDGNLLRPGAAPPTIIGYCEICGEPVERMQLGITSEFHIIVDAQCCGQTSGTRITLEGYKKLQRTGEKLFVIAKPKGVQGIKSRVRGSLMVGARGK